MVVASSGFRWIDLLEKELDKAIVDLDLIFGNFYFVVPHCLQFDTISFEVSALTQQLFNFSGELDEEESQLVKIARQRLASVASCFSQLTHKAQTVFQTNAKLEVSSFYFIENI
jgi:golgi-associated PDZ and coiled-coil motif-containing protein